MPDWFWHVTGIAAAAVGIYAGIRADLARMHERINAHHERLKTIERKVFQ